MKTKCQKQKPTKCRFTLLRQICNFIPNHLVRATAKVQGGDSTSLVAQSLRELARALAGWFGTIALVHSAKIRWADQPGQKPSVALRRVAPAFLGWRLFQVCRWSVKRRIKVQG